VTILARREFFLVDISGRSRLQILLIIRYRFSYLDRCKKKKFNIYLLGLLVLGGSEYEERFIIYRFYYNSEDLIIVVPLFLFEAPDDPSGLIAEDLVIRAALKPKDLLTPEHLSASGTVYQLLYFFFLEILVPSLYLAPTVYNYYYFLFFGGFSARTVPSPRPGLAAPIIRIKK
jgi:hypothetical protein